MMTDLHLSGIKRDTYALLYRFPIDVCIGPTNIPFFAETLCVAEKEVVDNINALIGDGLVSKKEYMYHGKPCVQYYTR